VQQQVHLHLDGPATWTLFLPLLGVITGWVLNTLTTRWLGRRSSRQEAAEKAEDSLNAARKLLERELRENKARDAYDSTPVLDAEHLIEDARAAVARLKHKALMERVAVAEFACGDVLGWEGGLTGVRATLKAIQSARVGLEPFLEGRRPKTVPAATFMPTVDEYKRIVEWDDDRGRPKYGRPYREWPNGPEPAVSPDSSRDES
jgi:hypothetical protein